MKMKLVYAVGGLVLTGGLFAAQEPAPPQSNYTDSTYGFAIDAPAFPKAGPGQPGVPVIMSGPAADGFASNVNVNIQQVATTRKEYLEQSLDQMRQVGLKVHSTSDVTVSGRDAIRLDYEGTISGRELHFLALAVIEKDRVVLVTCTALAKAFKEVEPAFRASLDSFRLK